MRKNFIMQVLSFLGGLASLFAFSVVIAGIGGSIVFVLDFLFFQPLGIVSIVFYCLFAVTFVFMIVTATLQVKEQNKVINETMDMLKEEQEKKSSSKKPTEDKDE